jgi:hypothetical protein
MRKIQADIKNELYPGLKIIPLSDGWEGDYSLKVCCDVKRIIKDMVIEECTHCRALGG